MKNVPVLPSPTDPREAVFFTHINSALKVAIDIAGDNPQKREHYLRASEKVAKLAGGLRSKEKE